MDKSTPLHDLPMMREDDDEMVDDILQELQKNDELLPPPMPSDALNSHFSQITNPPPKIPESQKQTERTYERIVWFIEHLKLPLIVIMFYMLLHNRSFTQSFLKLLPESLQDTLSFGQLIIRAILLAVLVEMATALWD